jgi:transcriptional regulator with PAS, ATPase and Fis domain
MQNERVKSELAAPSTPALVARSRAMAQLVEVATRAAVRPAKILITGESGVGKDVLARYIHARSPRATRPFIAVNCAGLAETLLESELFGHVKGSFTGAYRDKRGKLELADRGTIFLDEVGEMTPRMQSLLLRFLESGEIQPVGAESPVRRVDARVVAATNRDLDRMTAAGTFREDLLYRIRVVHLHVPPLRERVEDIPYLTASFINECAVRLHRTITGVAPAAERLLQQATWPGNVNELRDVVEQACAVAENRILGERDFMAAFASRAAATESTVPGTAEPAAFPTPEDSRFAGEQRDRIARVLREANGNKAAAAKLLGISRRSLYRWIDRLDVTD